MKIIFKFILFSTSLSKEIEFLITISEGNFVFRNPRSRLGMVRSLPHLPSGEAARTSERVAGRAKRVPKIKFLELSTPLFPGPPKSFLPCREFS